MIVNIHNTAGFRKAWNTASITGITSTLVSKSELYKQAKNILANPPIAKPAMPSIEAAK